MMTGERGLTCNLLCGDLEGVACGVTHPKGRLQGMEVQGPYSEVEYRGLALPIHPIEKSQHSVSAKTKGK